MSSWVKVNLFLLQLCILHKKFVCKVYLFGCWCCCWLWWYFWRLLRTIIVSSVLSSDRKAESAALISTVVASELMKKTKTKPSKPAPALRDACH